jgi:hypothetical protein
VRPIQEIYPDQYKEFHESEGYFYGPCDYDPLLNSFGYEILIKVDDSDYQGDSRVLYKDGDKIGLLIFGWGSCSGCGSLQACHTIQDIEELQKELYEKIEWFNDKKEALQYFETHDWLGDYCWHEEETKEFVEKCIKFLSESQ